MRHPSTHSLKDLPPIDDMIRLSKGLAMLDAILSPEWDYRYYSFNSKWGPGEMMASMRNGSGDEYFILFDKNGAAIKGFDHEATISPWRKGQPNIWPGMYANVPAEFSSFLNEPAFSMSDVTFCIWRRYLDECWQCGIRELPVDDDPDGSGWMLEVFNCEPKTYQAFARNYYEIELPLAPIEHIYEHRPLSQEVLQFLNSKLMLADIRTDANEIAYPLDMV